MKRIFVFLFILSCFFQEKCNAQIVKFKLSDNQEFFMLRSLVSNSAFSASLAVWDAFEISKEEREICIIERSITPQSLQDMATFMTIKNSRDRDGLLADLNMDSDKNRLYSFLKALDYFAFKDIPETNHLFPKPIIKDFAQARSAGAIFEKSLQHLVNNDKEVGGFSKKLKPGCIKNKLDKLIKDKAGRDSYLRSSNYSFPSTNWAPRL